MHHAPGSMFKKKVKIVICGENLSSADLIIQFKEIFTDNKFLYKVLLKYINTVSDNLTRTHTARAFMF